jgi:hypothetical protein
MAEAAVGLPLQDLAQRPRLRSAQLYLRPCGQPQPVTPLEPREDFFHPIQVDDGSAVGTEEAGRVQPRLQFGHRAADEICPVPYVDHHLLPFNTDPVHLVRVQHADAITVAHRQPGQVLPLGGQALQQRAKPRRETLLLAQGFPSATNGLPQSLPAEGLE